MALIKPFPIIETKTRKLPANGVNPAYYKIAKIQVRPTVDGGENASFQGSVFPQSDIAYTGSAQPLFTFSFGVRASGAPNQLLIKPSLLKVGDSRENSFRFEIYRDAEKNHYLYIVQSPYSLQTVFTYTQVGCTEYWEYDNHFSERGYDLVWSSVNGDTQGIYEGGRRLLTEVKANDTYMKKVVTNRINVDLREGWFHSENPLSFTKRADIATLTGAVLHGKDGPYQVIGKVPTGYEPVRETVLAACYLKDDGSFASIPIVISIYGELIQLGLRINNNKDRTITNISGTWETIGGM
ncbi:hypothetical protein FNE58_20045 [Bacillus thuringiensis]|uniref:Uncharacterized protein n=2 Tax=Bacillus cereus group TaxID=86661 RepID=A0A9W4A216_BACTO|nr:hypothetical protein [Bacillus thuringiensis]MDR5041724.1 hypothetical protein [Bacillus thuringiensis]MEB9590249.1 hypothetical protein [Bacillus cereus]BAR87878.1 uncharacterized protein KNN_07145 [Bacillus thuringiensis serovar tolworthi]